jgi:hypothetical protein
MRLELEHEDTGGHPGGERADKRVEGEGELLPILAHGRSWEGAGDTTQSRCATAD